MRTLLAATRRKGWPLDLAVFGLALAIRLAYLADSADGPGFAAPAVDAARYDALARHLAAGGAVDQEFFWQPCLYPFFLGGLYALSGGSILFAKGVQALLGALACLLTARLGRAALDAPTGHLAGAALALFGPAVFYDGELLGAGLACLWAVALLLLCFRAAARLDRWWLHAGLGVVAALAVLTRPDFLLAVSGGAFYLLVRWWRLGQKWRAAIAPLAWLVLGFAVTAAPAVLWSRHLSGHLALTPTSGGLNLYLGNNPAPCQTLTVRPGLAWERLVNPPARAGVAPEPYAQQAFFERQVVDYLRADPLGFLGGLGGKVLRLLSSRELPRNEDPVTYREWSGLLGVLLWRAGPFGFPMGLLLPLAGIGLALGWRRIPLDWKGFLLLESAAIVLVFVSSRYRLPLAPVLCLLAAVGVREGGRALRERRWRTAGVGLAVGAALVVISTVPGPFCEERGNFQAEVHLGAGAYRMAQGESEAAIDQYRQALALYPAFLEAHYNLGLAWMQQGQGEAAVAEFRRVTEIDAEFVGGFMNLAEALAAQGQLEGAQAAAGRGLAAAAAEPERSRQAEIRARLMAYHAGRPFGRVWQD